MDRNFLERLHDFVELAMQEDIGEGDHTTLSTVSPTQSGEAKLLVKEAGILAGVDVGVAIIQYIDSSMEVEVMLHDGDRVAVGDIVLYMRGGIHAILKIERLLLNVMQRMSGIATRTRSYVDLLSDTAASVLDTRKTTPGIRFLEKEAVRIGGGTNHRFGLYDMILIKDNHVDYAGGISAALQSAFQYRKTKHLTLPIEIEVRSMEELKQVLDSAEKVDRVMLDNFTPAETKEAVQLINGRLITESSGGITMDTIHEYALAGVDFISVGALTHSVKSLDLSLKAKLI